jgi:hypothetical protein
MFVIAVLNLAALSGEFIQLLCCFYFGQICFLSHFKGYQGSNYMMAAF